MADALDVEGGRFGEHRQHRGRGMRRVVARRRELPDLVDEASREELLEHVRTSLHQQVREPAVAEEAKQVAQPVGR